MRESGDRERKLEELLTRLVDEVITPDEFRILESLLDGDEAAQRRYLHYLSLHSELEESQLVPDLQASVQGQQIRWPGFAILVAAVVAVLAVIVALWPDRKMPSDVTVEKSSFREIGRIVEMNGSVMWTGDGGELIQDLDVGDRLGGGSLETLAQNSWIEIEFLDGSRIRVSGPTALTLSEGKEGKRVRLRNGVLSAKIMPQVEGCHFRVDTNFAELAVLSTQFNVVADESSTRVAVNEGRVEVRRLVDGKTVVVPTDHHLSVTLDDGVPLEVMSKRQVVYSWNSELPRDRRYGDWDGSLEPGRLKAKPLLWKDKAGNPLLLHVASLHPANSNASPIRLSGETQIRIRGRLNRSHPVVFGLTTLHPGGGFAGKFSTIKSITPDSNQGGFFETILPLGEFQPEKECFPANAKGHEVFDVWILTVREEVGLEVSEVEILAALSVGR